MSGKGKVPVEDFSRAYQLGRLWLIVNRLSLEDITALADELRDIELEEQGLMSRPNNGPPLRLAFAGKA